MHDTDELKSRLFDLFALLHEVDNEHLDNRRSRFNQRKEEIRRNLSDYSNNNYAEQLRLIGGLYSTRTPHKVIDCLAEKIFKNFQDRQTLISGFKTICKGDGTESTACCLFQQYKYDVDSNGNEKSQLPFSLITKFAFLLTDESFPIFDRQIREVYNLFNCIFQFGLPNDINQRDINNFVNRVNSILERLKEFLNLNADISYRDWDLFAWYFNSLISNIEATRNLAICKLNANIADEVVRGLLISTADCYRRSRDIV